MRLEVEARRSVGQERVMGLDLKITHGMKITQIGWYTRLARRNLTGWVYMICVEMCGEWVSDNYDGEYYKSGPKDNPKGPFKWILSCSSRWFMAKALRWRCAQQTGADACQWIGFNMKVFV